MSKKVKSFTSLQSSKGRYKSYLKDFEVENLKVLKSLKKVRTVLKNFNQQSEPE